MKLDEVRSLAHADTCSRRNGVYTVRREFFFTNGRKSSDFADALKASLEASGEWAVTVLDHGEVWKHRAIIALVGEIYSCEGLRKKTEK